MSFTFFIDPQDNPTLVDIDSEQYSFEQDSLDNVSNNHFHNNFHDEIDENVNYQQFQSSFRPNFKSQHEYRSQMSVVSTTTTATTSAVKSQINQRNMAFVSDFINYDDKNRSTALTFEVKQKTETKVFMGDYNFYHETNENKAPNITDDDEEEEKDQNLIMDGKSHFKLPARLQARLLKQHQQRQQNSNKSNCVSNTPRGGRILQTVENVPLARRETFLIQKVNKDALKPTTPMIAKNAFQEYRKQQQALNDTFDTSGIDPQTSPRQHHQTNSKIDNDEEDFRYVNWLNSVIKISFNIENVNVDLQRIIKDCILSSDSSALGEVVKAQPLKDGVSSIAYKELKLMDALRVKAELLYNQEMKTVEELLLTDLKIPRFHVRNDKNIHADVGAKKHILELFLNYNPLWLKVALECVFRTRIEKMSKSRSEVYTLIHVLSARLLSFKEAASKQRCKNLTTYFMKEANVVSAKRHILYHFLLLVHFLEVAKRRRLIDHDPCLFRTDATCKSTRDVVVSFSREYITGVGDITKALRVVGIHLEHVQSPIEEVNFTVNQLSTDLRDGVRLARLSEIILQRNDILPQLQFPPNSITRKLHNMEMVFRVLQPHFLSELPKTVTAKEVCNGYRLKTILLLDKIIEVFNDRVRMIELQQSIGSVIKIQRTWRRHLECRAQRKYFLQLRATAIFVQTIFRSKLQTMVIRKEFLQLRSAAIFVQRRFRANCAMRQEREKFLRMKSAATTLQQHIRGYIRMKQQREDYLRLRQAAIFVQKQWRQNILAHSDRQAYLAKISAVSKLQPILRGFIARKRFARLREMTNAALIVQRRFRANKEMTKARVQYQLMRRSSMTIQRYFRGHLKTQTERSNFIQMRKAAIVIQKRFRGYIAKKNYIEMRQKIVVIQRHIRGYLQMRNDRDYFVQLKQTTIIVQQRWRLKQLVKHDRQQFLLQKHSAILIQRAFRAHLEHKHFVQLRQATITIQQRWRANRVARIERENFLKIKLSAILIQRTWREYQRRREMTQAAVVIQRQFRALLTMRKCRAEYLQKKQAALVIQQRFRALVLGRQKRIEFIQLRQATLTLQQIFREKRRGNSFLKVVRDYFALSNQMATKIQCAWRGFQLRKKIDTKMPRIEYHRVQLQIATANATADKTLIALVEQILQRIRRARSISCLYKDLSSLDLYTSYSREICLHILQNEWLISTLINCVEALNRSEPHKKLLSDIFGVMLNLVRLTNTDLLFGREELLKTAVKTLRNFPKSTDLVKKSISFLIKLLNDPSSLKLLKDDLQSTEFLKTFIKSLKSTKVTTSGTNLINDGTILLGLLIK